MPFFMHWNSRKLACREWKGMKKREQQRCSALFHNNCLKAPPRQAEREWRSPNPAWAKGMHSPNPAFPEFPNWPTPPNSPPAIHRGHLPRPNSTLARVTAHGRTNLLHRGHTSPSQPPVTRVTAHGEMQELVKSCRRPQENYSPRGSRQSADNPQTIRGQNISNPPSRLPYVTHITVIPVT